MLKRIFHIALLFILALVLLICVWHIYKHIKMENADQLIYTEIYDRSIKKYESLKGLEINELSNILDIKNTSDTTLVYLFSANDCGPCIDRGFDFLKALKKEFKNTPNIYAISDNAAISGIQDRNDYVDFVYTDNDGVIRRKLKFCLTPVLFILQGNRILDMYFPKDKFDVNGRGKFKTWLSTKK